MTARTAHICRRMRFLEGHTTPRNTKSSFTAELPEEANNAVFLPSTLLLVDEAKDVERRVDCESSPPRCYPKAVMAVVIDFGLVLTWIAVFLAINEADNDDQYSSNGSGQSCVCNTAGRSTNIWKP